MKAIVAMDPYRTIGFRGGMPWPPIKEDFKWFKQMTMGGKLLMGRTTFEEMTVPLVGRFTYVLTTDVAKTLLPARKLYAYVSEEWINGLPTSLKNKFWVCGGAKVYEKFLPQCNEIYVSHILEEYEGDTYMPEFESMFPNATILKETKDFWIVKYFRNNLSDQISGIKFVI